MIPDNPTTTPPVVATVAIPNKMHILGDPDQGYWWECQTEGCDADADAGSKEEAILGAALHSFGHGKTVPSSALQETLAEAAGGRYTIRFPIRTGGGDVVVTYPGGLQDVRVHCQHCGWEWTRFSQLLTHAAAAVHAACAHDTNRPLPDELLDELADVVIPRRRLQTPEAVAELVGRATNATKNAVAEAKAPLLERIKELETNLQTLGSNAQDTRAKYTELVNERASQRLTTEIDRTDAQIARSDVKPGVVLTGLALVAPDGIRQLASGDLPLPAIIAGGAAAAVAAVGAVTLIVSVIPRIAPKWGGFGTVALAELSPEAIAERARDMAADPKALADADKVGNMARLVTRKHRLVRAGMLTTLVGAAPLALIATLIALITK